MRTVTFLGDFADNPKDGSINLGRFGIVTPNKVLDLTEAEYACIESDERFRLEGGELSEQEKAMGENILPLGTTLFDLRAIPWSNPRLGNILLSRTGSAKLRRIVSAIRLVGAHVDLADHKTASRAALADAVMAVRRQCNWGRFSREELLALPALSDTPVEPTEPVLRDDDLGERIEGEEGQTEPTEDADTDTAEATDTPVGDTEVVRQRNVGKGKRR